MNKMFKIDIQLFAGNQFSTEPPNNILPATENLKISGDAGTQSAGSFLGVLNNSTGNHIRTNNNNYNFMIGFPLTPDLTFLNYSVQIISGDYETMDFGYVSTCGVDRNSICSSNNFVILNTTGLSLEQRTISDVNNKLNDANFIGEDLDAPDTPDDESRILKFKDNSGKIVFKQNSFIEFKAEPSEYATIIEKETATNYEIALFFENYEGGAGPFIEYTRSFFYSINNGETGIEITNPNQTYYINTSQIKFKTHFIEPAADWHNLMVGTSMGGSNIVYLFSGDEEEFSQNILITENKNGYVRSTGMMAPI